MMRSVAVTAIDTHRTIDAVWRIESPRLIASLTRYVRDVGLAEELAQDALVAALEQWPESGVPEKPGAWLMSAAKHRAIDRGRHETMAGRKHQEIGRDLAALCEEALRLGRIVAELLQGEPEVHGLVALMEIQASRAKARVGRNGEPVLLLDQSRALWDRVLIGRGLAALARAERLGGGDGPY